MLYRCALRQNGRRDFHPKEEIEDSLNGVRFDYYYTGRREGPSGQIELHVTSVVVDWQDEIYTRKAWYGGHKETWRACIKEHIRDHLLDLGVDSLLAKRMLRELEVSQENFRDWEKYEPVRFRGVE